MLCDMWCKGIVDTYIDVLFGHCVISKGKKLPAFFNITVQYMINQNVIQDEHK